MRIAVIGAGITGLSTAYELIQRGHEVVVVDRRANIASEGSFAAGGLAAAWPAPPWPSPLAPALLGQHWLLRGRDWRWHRQWQRAASPAWAAKHLAARWALLGHGRVPFAAAVARHGWAFEHTPGALWVLREAAQVRAAEPLVQALREHGEPAGIMSREDVYSLDPALSREAQLLSAVHLPAANAANIRQIAHLLRETLSESKLEFQLGQELLDWRTDGARIQLSLQPPPPSSGFGQATSWPHGALSDLVVDAVVLCTGANTDLISRRLGLGRVLRSSWGWTVTAPLRVVEHGPRTTVIDELLGASVGRLGHRVRASGGFSIGARPTRPNERVLASLYSAIDTWYPGQTLRNQAQVWQGSSGVTFDNLPLLGEHPQQRGIWLNIGHGSSGWAQTWGAAAAIAASLSGQDCGLDLAPYAPLRPMGG